MKKIEHDKLKINVTKDEAIDILRQLHGERRDPILRNERFVKFRCYKSGKVFIKCYEKRYRAYLLTQLCAMIRQDNDETYIEYYTALNFLNMLTTILLILMLIPLVYYIFLKSKILAIVMLPTVIASIISGIIRIVGEIKESNADSYELVKILKNKVDIVNNWNK